jgi:flagellar biosynthetic protein FliP
MATYRPPNQLTIGPTSGAVRHFLVHIGEMVLAMFVGMALFGTLFSAILLAAGTTYASALETVPELIALALMVEMTVPMVLWMRHRGHSGARVAEMAGAMLAVGFVAVVLLWSSAIASTAICGVECALMLPAMVAVMLAHRGEYSRPAHRYTSRVSLLRRHSG